MLSYLRKSKLAAKSVITIFAFSLIGITPAPAPAQEQYPAVARLSFISGPVTYSRGDDPDEWDDAIENVPLTIGDRLYAPEGGRAELQLSSGNFVRIAPRSYLSTLNLSDDVKQFYLGEGAASFNIRRLQPDEVIEIDTPNVSVTLEEPGQYRFAIDDDGNSRIAVRRGRAIVAASGRQIAVENSEIRVYGIDSPRYEIVGLPAIDAFDRWVTERDDRFERAYSDGYRHASEDIIGAEDLAEYGRWEEIPEYGYAWTPSRVATGWAPFSDGRWYWQDPWGWSWISNERWGWATSHYGRWTPYRSRWYWVPVRPRTRVRYAPAVVEFVRVRDHVGWFPLHPRDRHTPWWERRDRQRFDRNNVTYVNRTHVTVVNHNTFITARPVNRYIVRDTVIIRDARSARFTESLPIPNRSSLRIVSDNGARRGHRPSTTVLNRTAVVRTALPNPPRVFQEKLPEIQKNQGRAVEPARVLAARDDDRAPNRVRVRSAAEARGGDFAARNPSANAGSELKPVTEARGKKLATRDNSDNNATEKTERAQKTPAVQQLPQAEPSKGTASRSDPRQEQDRDRQQDKQAADRARQTQQQREIERTKQVQEEQRKAQSQKQQEQERQQQVQERQAQQQKQRDLERRQAQQREEERKAQPQKQRAEPRQEPQERQSAQQRLEELERRQAQQREVERKAQVQKQQQERQQQAQERQAQQQQRQQDLERRAQEQERKAQAQQQQEQARREQQLRQQQAQERQARDQQRQQQEAARKQQQQQREQERNVQAQQRQEQARAQQLRQQQAQAQREAQQVQRQQEQERRPQPRPQPQQERPVPPQQQAPRQPGQL